MVTAGYKELARVLHPDMPGGSHDAMIRLNRMRDALKRYITDII
jgi:hypothetical protein